jgi:hypothetical protein
VTLAKKHGGNWSGLMKELYPDTQLQPLTKRQRRRWAFLPKAGGFNG